MASSAGREAHQPKSRRRRWPALATAGVLLLVGAAGLAEAGAAQAASATSTEPAASPEPVQLTVLSVSPSYATPGSTIVIKGRVSNNSRSAMTGLAVRLMSSTTRLTSSTSLEQFADGALGVTQTQVGGAPLAVSRLRGQHAKAFTIKLPAGDLRLNCFGVYPLTVQVTDVSGAVAASDPVPMPFWPNKAHSCSSAARPDPFAISWVWPLIDVPHQGPCPGLLDNSLEPSLAPGGRLSNLLTVGSGYSRSARLTWAIDPALLDNAKTMTRSYQVGSSPTCQPASTHPASKDAKTWLTDLGHATAGQPVFVTPYADVDVAGLAQYGDLADLRRSFSMGQRLAGTVLGRSRVPAPLPAGPKRLSAVAWPADGLANPAVLENLGAMKVGTVILAMPTPPADLSYTPGAVTSTIDGAGTKLKVLLGDNSLARLLAARTMASHRQGTIFGLSQLFLAETAMIVAEAPALQRPIMITPPRRWKPSKSLASDLLADTVTAPWLKPSTVAQLAAKPDQKVYGSVLRSRHAAELSAKLLTHLPRLDSRLTLLKSMIIGRNDRLSHALYGIESSAWAGAGASKSEQMRGRMANFVTSQLAGISVGGQHVIHVVLGGRVGSVTVSIHNSLGYAVRVGLRVRSSNNTVIATQRHPHQLYVVQAHSSTPLKLSVNATQTGKARLKLSLKSPTGVLLPDPPDKPLLMEISATNLGTVALVICAAALAVFVVASAAQAIRRGRPGAGSASKSPDAPDPADAPSSGDPGPAEETQPSDVPALTSPGPGMTDPPAQPEQRDKFEADRSKLSPVGHVPANPGPAQSRPAHSRPAQPGTSPTEESQ